MSIDKSIPNTSTYFVHHNQRINPGKTGIWRRDAAALMNPTVTRTKVDIRAQFFIFQSPIASANSMRDTRIRKNLANAGTSFPGDKRTNAGKAIALTKKKTAIAVTPLGRFISSPDAPALLVSFRCPSMKRIYGRMRFYCSIVFLAALVAAPVRAQNSSKTVRPKPIETTVCEIFRNPSVFNNKLVRVRGQVSVSFEYSLLHGEGCSDHAIWFDLADETGASGLGAVVNGNGKPGGKNSAGTPVPPLSLKLIRDSIFEKFEHYMTVKAKAKPCFNPPTQPTPADCGVDRVTATFTGRIDSVSKAVHEAHLKQKFGQGTDWKGFGHMGIFDAQLVVEQVEDVQAVDSFGRDKP